MEAVQPLDMRGDGIDGGGGGGRRLRLRRQERMQRAIDDDGDGVGIPAARRIDAGIFAIHNHCNAGNLIGLSSLASKEAISCTASLPIPLSLWGVVVRPVRPVGGPATVWPSYRVSRFSSFPAHLVSVSTQYLVRPKYYVVSSTPLAHL